MRDDTPDDLDLALQDALGGSAEPPALDVDVLWQEAAPRVRVTRASRHVGLWSSVVLATLVMLLVVGIVLRPSKAHQYATTAGQRLDVTLPDGTRITLAPETRLDVPSAFVHGNRQVQLTGEAYFAVVHNMKHPFSVLTDNFQINDVGTEFDVRAYDDDRDIHVAVAEGVVALVGAGRGNGRPLFGRAFLGPALPAHPNNPTAFQAISLSAGDMFSMDASGPIVTRHADIASAIAWRQGQLVFRNTPLARVARDLSRTFGLTVTLADTALASLPVTGAFGPDSAGEVLDEVTQVVGLIYDRSGQTVVIRRGALGAHERRADPIPVLRTASRSQHNER